MRRVLSPNEEIEIARFIDVVVLPSSATPEVIAITEEVFPSSPLSKLVLKDLNASVRAS